MERLISLQIDNNELELVEGFHDSIQVRGGNHHSGMHVDDLAVQMDGTINAIVALKHEDQIYEWMLKEHVRLSFKTEAGEFDFPKAEVTTKEEANDGVRIIVEYVKT